MTSTISDPRLLLGVSPSATILSDYLKQLAELTTSKQVPIPEIKSYSDVLYKNYYPLGLSLMFVAKDDSKSIGNIDPESDKLVIDSIDVYNAVEPDDRNPGSESTSALTSPSTATFASYPAPSLVLSLLPSTDKSNSRPGEIILTGSSTGKVIVDALREPDRKGGGTGPSSGSIGIWCEWSKDGIMIEFGGTDTRGPQAWERGKDAKWRVLTLFLSK